MSHELLLSSILSTKDIYGKSCLNSCSILCQSFFVNTCHCYSTIFIQFFLVMPDVSGNDDIKKITIIIIIRVGPDIRQFSISGRIPDNETIQMPDIRLIYNAGYPVICRISSVGQISGRIPDIRHYKSTGYPVSGQKNILHNPNHNTKVHYVF